MNDLFRQARERVSAREAAGRYGLTVDRRGWALCPFHDDRHPSMSFKGSRFRCWVCGASGDSIDLTARLFGLDAAGALRRINTDFGLGFALDRPPTEKECEAARYQQRVREAHQAFEQWRSGMIGRLNDAFRRGHILLSSGQAPDSLTGAEAVAIRMHPVFEYWSDTLTYGTPREQAQIYRERGRIARWTDEALKN